MLMDVRKSLDTNMPTERAFPENLVNASGVAIAQLQPYEGRPLRELYVEAICGGAVLEFVAGDHTAATNVPMAFQSALAGILLAADVVAGAAKLRPPLATVTQIVCCTSFPWFRRTSGRNKCNPPACAVTGISSPPTVPNTRSRCAMQRRQDDLRT
jgi:hypothetical protein